MRLQGTITSNKMNKTVVVRVDQFKKHSRYLKFYRKSKKFKAHDEKGEFKEGDFVYIENTRPLSREKRWRVAELIKRPVAEEMET